MNEKIEFLYSLDKEEYLNYTDLTDKLIELMFEEHKQLKDNDLVYKVKISDMTDIEEISFYDFKYNQENTSTSKIINNSK